MKTGIGNVRRITEEAAGKRWEERNDIIWAEHGDPSSFIRGLNDQLAKHGLELVEIDIQASEAPMFLTQKE